MDPCNALHKDHSTKRLCFGLFLLSTTFLKISPTPNTLLSRILPILFMISFPFSRIQLLVRLLLLPSLFLHLRLHLSTSSVLIINQDQLSLFSPVLSELFRLELFAIDCPLVLADQEHAGIGDGFIESFAVLLVHKLCLRFFESVEGIGSLLVAGLVWMD